MVYASRISSIVMHKSISTLCGPGNRKYTPASAILQHSGLADHPNGYRQTVLTSDANLYTFSVAFVMMQSARVLIAVLVAIRFGSTIPEY